MRDGQAPSKIIPCNEKCISLLRKERVEAEDQVTATTRQTEAAHISSEDEVEQEEEEIQSGAAGGPQ